MADAAQATGHKTRTDQADKEREPAYLAVCGTVNPDLVLRLPRLPVADEAVPVLESYRTMGGTAANLALGAASLGVPTELVGETGGDFLTEFGPRLVKAGVGLRRLVQVEPAPLCRVLLAEDTSQAFLLDRGGAVDWAERLDQQQAMELAQAAHLFHLGTGHPAYYLKLVEALAQVKGVTVAFDPAQDLAYHYDEMTLRRLLAYADLLFCSLFELGLLRKLLHLPEGDRAAAEVLQSLGPRTVVVTRGRAGSTIYDRAQTILVPSLPAKAQGGSPTGAGDGYRAGFYGARYLGLGLAEQGLAGAAVASLVLENPEPVAAGLNWERVARRMEETPA